MKDIEVKQHGQAAIERVLAARGGEVPYDAMAALIDLARKHESVRRDLLAELEKQLWNAERDMELAWLCVVAVNGQQEPRLSDQFGDPCHHPRRRRVREAPDVVALGDERDIARRRVTDQVSPVLTGVLQSPAAFALARRLVLLWTAGLLHRSATRGQNPALSHGRQHGGGRGGS